MSDPKWTKPQLNAIGARGGPLLVSAAAGSGKTAVLVQRVIDIITDEENPVDIDRFLVVTFTRAAAAEMKQRISEALAELLKEDPFNRELIRQQLLLPKAQISTIDSFCSSLSREFFYALDIPADFRVIDDNEKNILQQQALDTVFDRMYEKGSGEFDDLAESFANAYDDSHLRSIVLRIPTFMDAQPFPESWARERLKNYETGGVASPWQTIWGSELKSYVTLAASFARSQIASAYSKAMSVPDFTRAQELTETELGIAEQLISHLDHGDWDEICTLFDSVEAYFKDQKRSRISFKNAKEGERLMIKEQITASRNLYKDILRKTIEPLFLRDSEAFFKEIKLIEPTARSLFELVFAFQEEYSRLKLERSVADYGDLEHWTLRLLVRETENKTELTEEAHRIAARYDFVMVDEYQDANLVQDTIFNAVSDQDRRLFVVSDVKQSIYRFRQAMPEIFMSRRDSSSPYDPDDPHYPASINLDANFRSRKCVTDCVNFVFSKLMSRSVGELDYTQDEALDPKAVYPEGDCPTQLCLLGMGQLKDDDKIAAEAGYIGAMINKMMKTEKVFDKGALRDPLYSDFCILMRSDKKTSAVYTKVLQKMGIPAVSEKGGSFFSQPEIRLMLSLLRSIDNPARDIPLAATLISPLFGFTSDDIGRLRTKYGGISLFEIMLAESQIDEKAGAFCEMFDELRSCSGNVTADELIRRIYDETLLPELVLSGNDGEFRRRNLRLLLEYAKGYEESGFRGVSGFIAFLDRLKENGKDLSTASRAGSAADNAVSVLSIHKSKGLQFAFCFVSNLGGRFNRSDTSSDVIVHSRVGLGTEVINSEKLYSYKGITRLSVEHSLEMSLVSEELRILYVAMTRAKERLIMTAAVSDVHKTILEAADKLIVEDGRISPYLVMTSKCFAEQLLYCLLTSRSAQNIRDMYGLDVYVDDSDESCWDITLVEDVTRQQPKAYIADGTTLQELDEAPEENEASESDVAKQLETIDDKLSRKYAFSKACSIPSKVAASAVAEHSSGRTNGAASRPSFMNSGSLTAAQKGTALHAFAQYCDFERAKQSLDSEKDRLVEKGFLTRAQADCISDFKVRRFLSSPLVSEMLSAQLLEREYQYMTEIPALLIDPTLKAPYSEEKVVLQGAIDCIYELNGELVIVDYKTDRSKTADELAQHYSPQLRLYKHAAEQIFGKEVSRCVLYSFELGEEIEVEV